MAVKKKVDELTYEKKSAYEIAPEKTDAAYKYAEGYMSFLGSAKTEREAVAAAVKMAEDAGFVPFKFGMKIKAGDKLYYNNRGKSLYLVRVGKENLEKGIRIMAAHVDSPRIDLKQVPLYESDGMAFFKTHYYGGLRKYQWTTIPLALHGVIVKRDGERIDVNIGEDDSDPIFYINDLLPHLAQEQSKLTLEKAHSGEVLNLLCGSRPIDGEENGIKRNVLKLLNDKYGINESDFISSELCVVPAAKPRDVGFDRSLIAAYGHDDRVCAYPAVSAILNLKSATHTVMAILADKEEIGSDGVSGMKCKAWGDIIADLANTLGANERAVRANSKCLSADVTAAFDPNFPDVFEKRNASILGCGTTMSKFTGSRGKYDTSDASAEYVGFIRSLLDENKVVWQCAELGKVDLGGGGTVAKFIAQENIDTLDLGVPVISMHAPIEIISKVDLYSTYCAFAAFIK